MKAYKGFDSNMMCRGFQFVVGETYIHEGPLELCATGFHFCTDLVLCFNYYLPAEHNIFCEVEILGDVIWDQPTRHKGVTNKIKIISTVDISTIVDKKNNSGRWNSGDWNSGNLNSGNRNSGNWNSGDRNSGNWNSGDWNSGDRNSGNRNSGNLNSGNLNSGNWNSGDSNSGDSNSGSWNSCSNETGFFNTTDAETIRVFNTLVGREEWNSTSKPKFIYFDLVEGKTYKECFVAAFENADSDDISKLKALPGFDAQVFFEISGIKLD